MAHEKEELKEVLQYPLDSKSYKILDEGSGAGSVVYKAICMPMNSMVVAIKVVDPVDDRLWVVMPFMSAGSLQSIITSFPNGFCEPCIAIILKEILSALSYLDKKADVHKYIKTANILIDSNGSMKLPNFGLTLTSDVSGTPDWIGVAPENWPTDTLLCLIITSLLQSTRISPKISKTWGLRVSIKTHQRGPRQRHY
ncbi:hypothetical protein FH972_019619 [Carpinus fangiana]|uniref:Protein kinase domain-containing protein n=1 Tax=Carpinus fangiana TaxID=176857 RepID=A0A5N6RU69_9ROSI|nr:hypothetical protein FH972_019619 [Carpinus fangiana]